MVSFPKSSHKFCHSFNTMLHKAPCYNMHHSIYHGIYQTNFVTDVNLYGDANSHDVHMIQYGSSCHICNLRYLFFSSYPMYSHPTVYSSPNEPPLLCIYIKLLHACMYLCKDGCLGLFASYIFMEWLWRHCVYQKHSQRLNETDGQYYNVHLIEPVLKRQCD